MAQKEIKKKTRIYALIAVLIVAALGIYYVAHELTTENQNTTTPSKNPIPPPTSTPVSTATPTATSSPAPTTTPTETQTPADSISVVSVVLLQPYNPGGPTIELTLENVGNNSVTSLQAILSLSGNNYTYTFDEVSQSNPLLPDQEASQTKTLLNAGFEQDQTYPLEIIGYQQNGARIDYTTPVTISSATSSATGDNGELQLTLTVEKTTFSLGEPVNITLTLTNISNETISFTHTGLDFNFQVYNDSNNLVYQWSNFMAIPQFVAIEPFPAGESMSQSFTWLQTCNFNISVNGDPVSAGTYSIVGQSSSAYGIQTPPVQITILKP